MSFDSPWENESPAAGRSKSFHKLKVIVVFLTLISYPEITVAVPEAVWNLPKRGGDPIVIQNWKGYAGLGTSFLALVVSEIVGVE
jgi:hypothetical protein